MDKRIINLYENKNQLLYAAIDKITVKIIDMKKTDGAQSIVLTGVSPLAGTTSTAISLAIAMAATSRKTLLIDCDVRKSREYKKLNDQIDKGLADYVSAKTENEVTIEDLLYPTNVDNLYYLPCGTTEENTTRILCSEKLNFLLQELKNLFDCIILDCPSISIVPDAQIMFKKVDGIIFVSALGETKRSQIKDARSIIEEYKGLYYGMIINKIPKDLYKKNVKNADYYLTDKKGKQRFAKNKAFKSRNRIKTEFENYENTENAD